VTEEKKELILQSTLDSVEKAAIEAESFAKDAGLSDDAIYALDMAVRAKPLLMRLNTAISKMKLKRWKSHLVIYQRA
jgi:hypothetical protein